MPSILQCLFLIALVACVLAAPAPNPRAIQKRSFKVERVPNPNFRRAANHKRAPGAGTRAMIRAHRKFSVPLPAGLLEAMGAAQAAGGAGNTPQIGDLITSLTGDKEAGQQIDELVAGLNGGHGSGKKHHGAKPGGANVTGTSSSAPSAGTGVTSSGSLAANASGAGVVTATPEQGDIEYLAPVTIGGQTINMDFDSGSSDLWVFNTQLSAKTLSGHTVYDPQQSKDFQVLQGASYTISYGDGSGCAGNVGTDTVNIGGVSVTSQAVELPTAVSASFIQDTQSNGLVGLAFSNINTVKPTQQKTFFDNAIPSLPEPVFTADLRANAVGAYEFGNIDTSKFNGSLSWASINNTSGFWQFSSEKFVVAGGAPMTVAGGQAIADTGTTLMLVNSAVVNAYYSKVQGAVNNDTVGGVTFPCDSDLPDLQIDIGGNLANVRGDDINFSPVDATGTTCFGGLQAIDSSLQIYGDIFFKSQFVAFNGGNNSIGVAPHQS